MSIFICENAENLIIQPVVTIIGTHQQTKSEREEGKNKKPATNRNFHTLKIMYAVLIVARELDILMILGPYAKGVLTFKKKTIGRNLGKKNFWNGREGMMVQWKMQQNIFVA